MDADDFTIRIERGTSGPKRWCYRITGPHGFSPLEGAAMGTKKQVTEHVDRLVAQYVSRHKGQIFCTSKRKAA